MYRPKAFAVDDQAVLHDFIRQRAFATIATVIADEAVLAHAPVVLDAASGLGAVRFHLAKNNPMAAVPDGTRMRFSFAGHDAYVSPDWYASQGMVPTWNYMAVEGAGRARRLSGEELHALLVDLSAAQEEKLVPKKPWTIDKVPDERVSALMAAIVGFAVALETLEGKFKLSQDKKPEDIEGVIRGLKARGDPASVAVALAMWRSNK